MSPVAHQAKGWTGEIWNLNHCSFSHNAVQVMRRVKRQFSLAIIFSSMMAFPMVLKLYMIRQLIKGPQKPSVRSSRCNLPLSAYSYYLCITTWSQQSSAGIHGCTCHVMHPHNPFTNTTKSVEIVMGYCIHKTEGYHAAFHLHDSSAENIEYISYICSFWMVSFSLTVITMLPCLPAWLLTSLTWS